MSKTWGDLAPELVIKVAGFAEPAGVLALMKTYRGNYHCLVNELYRWHGGRAVARWAAEEGSLATLKQAVTCAKDDVESRKLLEDPLDLDWHPKGLDQYGVAWVYKDVREPDWRAAQPGQPRQAIVRATLLHIACAGGHNDIVSYLLEKGVDMGTGSYRYCNCRYLPRDRRERVEIPEWLPLHHAICNVPRQPNSFGPQRTVIAIHSAVKHGEVKVLKKLRQRYVEGHAPTDDQFSDKDHRTPLDYVALCYRDRDTISKIISLLIKFNVFDLNEHDSVNLAVRMGNYRAAHSLIKRLPYQKGFAWVYTLIDYPDDCNSRNFFSETYVRILAADHRGGDTS
ncbi:hypothetical protein QBC46DRAFT_419111 [Diplogelasinospora grovesii]|uniref:Ankyrin repeat protein n=1 Tax=Diplogelasinospora grovesii TaxID=303347 RepID=A0AAN6S120_9PEZI|nr:hypothetical protein QBC46DRAFT_419111 [Diplogelasinospora grovesii]